LEDVLDVLEKFTYTEILLYIIGGKNYATSIARLLKKRQPTVTEQLKVLEKLQLIKPIKRDKSKKYTVNWDILLEVFYEVVNDVLQNRKEFLSKEEVKRIEEIGIENIIPPRLIKDFLGEYAFAYMEFGGKRKGFDEIIFSFFSALNNLDKSYRKRLVKEFDIDEKSLLALANLMEFEISGLEQAALMTYLDMSNDERQKSKG